jgi:hypothetical protein
MSSGECFLKINGETSDTLFVSFAGHDLVYGGIPRFEFVQFFNKHFATINRHFYIDKFKASYHNGIHGISTNIDETAEYLKSEIQNYKNVVFLGVSSGGYAAILFGSLLNVKSVVAFIPQTIRRYKHVDEKYRDIKPYINSTTQYYLYGDSTITNIYDAHHISHCTRIYNDSNVFITNKPRISLKKMRDSGELYAIMKNAI